MIKYGTPRSKSHTFNSPNFPQAYPASIACVLYWFVGDANHIVQLRFLEFDLEAASHALPSRSSRYVSCDYRIYPPPEIPPRRNPTSFLTPTIIRTLNLNLTLTLAVTVTGISNLNSKLG